MATVVSNQLTFLDMTDQTKLSIYLTSNLQTIQIYDADKNLYNPSWIDTPLEITLNSFLDQNPISSNLEIEWFVKDGIQETKINGQTSKMLKISTNELSESESNMLTYICKVSYVDSVTNKIIDSAESQLTYTLLEATKGETGISAVTFQVYAPYGNVFYNSQPETLQIQAIGYKGIEKITSGATYEWHKYMGDYEIISGANADIYDVNHLEVVNVQTYKCVMTYEGEQYEAVITFEDKSDTYVSEMLTIGGNVFKNGQGGSAVYVIVRSNGREVDAFPDGCSIGTSEPSNFTEGSYWWKVDGTATFMKYNGAAWEETFDDTQQLDYIWTLMDQNGNVTEFYKTGKVIYLSCAEIDNIGTLQCDVKDKRGTTSYNNGMVSVNNNAGISATNDDNGNVEITSRQTYIITDDDHGNVVIS